MTTQANNNQKKQNSLVFLIPTKPVDFEVAMVKDSYSNIVATIKDVPGDDKNSRFQVMDGNGNFKYAKPSLAKAMESIKAEEPELLKLAYKKRLEFNIDKRRNEITILSGNLKNLDQEKEVPAPSM